MSLKLIDVFQNKIEENEFIVLSLYDTETHYTKNKYFKLTPYLKQNYEFIEGLCGNDITDIFKPSGLTKDGNIALNIVL